MNIVLIHGQSHKSSTYHTAHMLAEKVGGEITDFFLPKDFGEFCTGCCNCFTESEKLCPHYEKIKMITESMKQADVIILASPVYAFHATGAMKAFLDHYAYQWMVHSPEETMFKKQGVVISTAAGGGMKSTNKDMKDSLFFWGVAKIYQFGKGVAETNWTRVSEKKKKAIDTKLTKIAKKIQEREGKVTPKIATKMFFWVMHLLQRNGFNPRDAKHWKEHGWTEKTRPWKV